MSGLENNGSQLDKVKKKFRFAWYPLHFTGHWKPDNTTDVIGNSIKIEGILKIFRNSVQLLVIFMFWAFRADFYAP